MRDRLIELLFKVTKEKDCPQPHELADYLLENDIVKVVRCKDCKYYKPYNKLVEDFEGECIVRECETDETEFCSYGGRKVEGK